MTNLGRRAEIRYTNQGPQPVVELSVPHGTQLADLAAVLKLISVKINPTISPRGCEACTSGTHLIIKEMFENVVQVDLDAGQIIGQ